jgi:hypothetical protein
VLAKAKGNGYPDAFVVGYKNGTRLDNNQLKAYEGH